MSLYAEVVGADWQSLPATLRGLFGAEGSVRATGVFDVVRGKNPFSRAAASLAGLPAEGHGVPTTIRIAPAGDGVQWTRRFADHVFATIQSQRGDRLVERVGPLEYLFDLRIEDGALVFHQTGVVFAVGWLRIPLPRVLGGSVLARASDEEGQIHTSVSIRAPVVGLLVKYEGLLDPAESD